MNIDRKDYTEMTEEEIFDTFVSAGLPEDAARFCTEWMPEYIGYAYDRLQYGYYDWQTFGIMTEDELSEWLNYHDVTEDDYQERYGTIVRDAAFDGVLVMGE